MSNDYSGHLFFRWIVLRILQKYGTHSNGQHISAKRLAIVIALIDLSKSGRALDPTPISYNSVIVLVIYNFGSQGHYLYGLCTIACAALPGILFALSDFYNYKGFTFGRLLCNPSMRKWPLLIKLLVLPFYILMMIPSVIFVTLFR